MADSASHHIYPYRAPRRLTQNLWQIQGSLKLPIPRNMTIWRAPDKRLVLYGVIAMHEPGMKAIEEMGDPAFMVIPHRRHRMDAAYYQSRFPRIRTVADTAMAATNFRIDGSLKELTTAFGIHAQRIPGTSYDDVALELPIPGGLALCVCELLGNVPGAGIVGRALSRLLGPPQPGCGVARVVRYREVVDRERVKAWLRELAGRIDLLMLLVGHGEPTLDAESVRSVLSRASDQV